MQQILHRLTLQDLSFPPTEQALSEPNGLLAVGGDLSPPRIINAYTNGIFPWFSEGDPILWWSPDPRAVLPLDKLRINRSLTKFLKKSPYQVTLNKAFNQVIELCADAPFRQEDTWILPSMMQAYQQLHQQGFAHSIEVWQDNYLVGGLYGICIGGFFSGESMFYRAENASKVALVALRNHLLSEHVDFIDCQIQNPFLQSMGAIEISRQAFSQAQARATQRQFNDQFWQPQALHLDY
ncbi:leucyl/phenylalanyl-tRNA--protein transferase [Thalassotalea mangrovi]|uniref:Leucyl/phenylalanyl-tRNA--protein transferase n=1 Tax=Thalassotalea mangrovi TaxID=2572245 RepID=A0A4U1B3I9_9GAMM|nr:leucyl/phenylalanyl-tRNA--protein transferase [Thalassotalea mangrovi]TKB43745.1 leucyl/phenylalanyl-tRNA--protein transferase [Thalassotalea mangrovi]